MEHLRRFHNKVNERLLHDALHMARDGNGQVVLDLACGVMGDVQKLARSRRIGRVVAPDMDAMALEEALRRSSTFLKCMDIDIRPAIDCSNFQAISDSLAGEEFDIIMCNFAVQYLVPHQGLIELLTRHLRDQASTFIGAVMNGDKVLKVLEHGRYHNRLIEIVSTGGTLGVSMKSKTRYYDQPGTSITEPLFDPETFVSSAMEGGLRLRSLHSFQDYDYPPNYSKDQASTSSLYDTFIWQRL
jgi:hypothetical protein